MAAIPGKRQPKAIRHRFSALEDTNITKQIHATHAPVDRHIDVRFILNVAQDIFHRATSLIPDIVQQAPLVAINDDAYQPCLADEEDILSHTISRISCEITCKCVDGGDAHATTIGILGMLSSYSWDAKVVIALAAFAANLGQIWLVVQLHATNHLAMLIGRLKHTHETLEHVDDLRLKFEVFNDLLNAMLNLTNCIVEFHELPSQYIDPEASAMLTASTLIPSAVYWTIRSIVPCSSQIFRMIDLGKGEMTSAIETGVLDNINSRLRRQLTFCHRRLDDTKQREEIETIQLLFETSHQVNLKALICSNDKVLPLYDGSTKQPVGMDVLWRKTVLLYITDLHHVSDQELVIFEQMYQESRQVRTRLVGQYELVWLPVVDKGTPRPELKQKFEELQSMMPWYSLHEPSLLEPASIRYIKEVWLFNAKPILVVLDQRGKVANLNAQHMLWIWGNTAYPFSSSRERELWEKQTWGLELLADTIDPLLLNWVSEGKYICLFGGDDIEWIQNLTRAAHSMASALQVPLEMVYLGKRNQGEKVKKINETIYEENFSHVHPYVHLYDLILIAFFWYRVESIWHSKLQLNKTAANDMIMHEIMRILCFDSSDKGWVAIGQGWEKMALAKGDTFLKCLNEYDLWKDRTRDNGILPAITDYIKGIQTPHHCNTLILLGENYNIPEVVCDECGQSFSFVF